MRRSLQGAGVYGTETPEEPGRAEVQTRGPLSGCIAMVYEGLAHQRQLMSSVHGHNSMALSSILHSCSKHPHNEGPADKSWEISVCCLCLHKSVVHTTLRHSRRGVTSIQQDGEWVQQTHPGTSYAALLVKPTY